MPWIHRKLARLLLGAALAVAAATCAVPSASAAGPPLAYGGRLTDGTGQPVAGPVDLAVSFYRDASGGTPLLGEPLSFPATALANGVFELPFNLAAADFETVFADVGLPVYLEVKDTTHQKTYPRQRFLTVPFAAKVPVDGTSVTYDAGGRLTVGPSAAPAANQFLTKDSSGALVWGTPSTNATSLAGAGIAATSPTTGSVLKYASGQWQPAADTGVNRTGDSGLGPLVLAPAATLGLGTFVTDPAGLTSADKGKTWFNTATNQIKYWDGSVAQVVGASGSGLANLNGQVGNTQTFGAPGVAGLSPAWTSLANVHTLNLPLASATGVTAGLLANSDYVAFSAKVNRAGDALTGNLTTTAAIGVGTTTPATALDVTGALTQRAAPAPGLSGGGQSRVYFDSAQAQLLVSQNGGAYVPLATGGTVTGVTAGTGLSGGGTSGTVTLTLASVGTAGTYTKVLTDAQGRVTAGAGLTAADVPALSATQITSGTLAAAQIPALDAAKVATGTFAAALIPPLDAAKIATGTFAATQIPVLDAARITTGTLATAQIPPLDAGRITSGTLSATQLPALDAAKIATGTLAAAQIPGLDASRIVSGTFTPALIPSLDAGKIASGTFVATQIPALDAGKITTGTLASAQIPALDAGKITTGTLASAQIPALDAGKTTTGTFAAAQIPGLDASKITSGTLAPTAVPALDASKIATGTFNTVQIPALDAAKIATGTFAATQVPALDASKIATGTFTSAQIPALDATKIATGTFAATQIPALDATKIATGTFTSAQIPALDATKIATGTFTSAQIPALDATKVATGTFAATQIPALDATKITTGTFTTTQIPALDAAKITTGAFTTAQIPTLDAAKIGSGTFAATQIPALDAAKIATGTFAAAQIPPLDASKTVSGTFAPAQIPALDAAKITTGALGTAQIPALDAGKITTGTFAAAQIPALDAGKVTTGTFAAAQIPALDAGKITTGLVPVADGGTGANSFTANGILVGGGAGPLSATAAGTQGNVLTVNGSNQPVFGALSLGSANAVSGTLAVANGGTGSGTALANNRHMMSSGGTIVEAPALTNGQLFVGSTGAAPAVGGLSPGATQGVTIATGPGTLTLDTVQDIRTSATPAFNGLKLTTPSPGGLVKIGTGGTLTAATGADVTTLIGPIGWVLRTGDTMTGSLTLPADGLAVGAGELVASGGNVGVGTPTPAFPLDVSKNPGAHNWLTQFHNTFAGGSTVYLAHTDGYGIYADAGSNASSNTYALNVNKSGNSLLYVRGDGAVGVGTFSPQTTFDVNGYAEVYNRTTGASILNLLTTTNNNASYVNFGAISGYGWQVGKDVDAGSVGGANGFYVYDLASSAPRLVINTNGNVGLGTTSPGQKLSVAGTVESTSGGFKFPDATTQATASGNFVLGSFTAPAATGNYSVTGLGFKPKLVRIIVNASRTGTMNGVSTSVCQGSMTASGQFAFEWYANSSAVRNLHTTSHVVHCTASDSTDPTIEANFVSMDSGGFTINFTTTVNTWTVFYEAMN